MEVVRRAGRLARTSTDEHDTSRPILELKGVTVRFGKIKALDNISFQLNQGERVAVIGPNGAGKSTLFNIISGVLPPTEGQVDIYGYAPGGHICIAYVPQRSQVDWQFPVNVADVVMMGRVGKLGLFRWPRRADREPGFPGPGTGGHGPSGEAPDRRTFGWAAAAGFYRQSAGPGSRIDADG